MRKHGSICYQNTTNFEPCYGNVCRHICGDGCVHVCGDIHGRDQTIVRRDGIWHQYLVAGRVNHRKHDSHHILLMFPHCIQSRLSSIYIINLSLKQSVITSDTLTSQSPMIRHCNAMPDSGRVDGIVCSCMLVQGCAGHCTFCLNKMLVHWGESSIYIWWLLQTEHRMFLLITLPHLIVTNGKRCH